MQSIEIQFICSRSRFRSCTRSRFRFAIETVSPTAIETRLPAATILLPLIFGPMQKPPCCYPPFGPPATANLLSAPLQQPQLLSVHSPVNMWTCEFPKGTCGFADIAEVEHRRRGGWTSSRRLDIVAEVGHRRRPPEHHPFASNTSPLPQHPSPSHTSPFPRTS
jgi:hypothetical protein